MNEKKKSTRLFFTPLALILLGGLWFFCGILTQTQEVEVNRLGFYVLLGFGFTYIIAGIGLFRSSPWSINMAIILYALLVFAFPIGTIIAFLVIPKLRRLSKSITEATPNGLIFTLSSFPDRAAAKFRLKKLRVEPICFAYIRQPRHASPQDFAAGENIKDTHVLDGILGAFWCFFCYFLSSVEDVWKSIS